MKRRGLGKGLDAIFAENLQEDKNASITVAINEIEPNRSQPRRTFEPAALEELSESIAQHGVLQPLLVRPLMTGGYQIVAGERRWRAARMAGVREVPVIIRDLTDAQVMELALVENLQREDLNPLEEADGYQTLMTQYQLTQEEIASAVGKSRPAVTNALRLLNLPKEIQEMLENKRISAGHARALLALEEMPMLAVARQICEQGLSVRDTEKIVQSLKKAKDSPEARKKARKDPYISEVELALKELLGRRVRLRGSENKGVLQIEYYSREDLQVLLQYFSEENK